VSETARVAAEVELADVCAVACADAWRGDGEILASAFGRIPTIGARLAKATFEPDLLVTDGESYLVANALRLDAPDDEKVIEGWLPFRTVFETVWAGRRHAMLGASQLDRYGNSNIACIGDWARPKAQLIGVRGSPGNTINHPVSYWVPNHSPRVFVERVDFVSGVGYDRARDAGVDRHHEIRRVTTNLGVFDFDTPDRAMRLRSLHPGVSVDDVREATGFELAVPEHVPESRAPTEEEVHLIRDVIDPTGRRYEEVPRA
jgi:acyl CoA:acetate/3-ketoacid CoA transferase beta subunit